MKKVLIIIFELVFIFSITFSTITYADDYNEEETEGINLEETVAASSQIADEPQINSRNVAIFDRTSNEVIYGKNENKRVAMASTTKIMTCTVVLEKGNINDEIEVSATAASIGGSRLGLKKGDKVKIIDLLYGLMLRSGNDAAYALAEYIAGSKEGFAECMNNKAKELKLQNTHFVTPHGLDDPEHYTTATELAMLTDYALNNETFAKIVNTKSTTIYINGAPRTINNTNELLGHLQGVNGVKTGFTNNAGRCLVTSVNRDDRNIICVVLGADTKKIRTSDSIKLIEYVYKNFTHVNIKDMANVKFNEWKDINKGMIFVDKAKYNNLDLEMDFNGCEVRCMKNTEVDNINFEFNILTRLDAPVEKGRVLGNIVVKNGNKILATIEIKNKFNVEKRDLNSYLRIFFEEIVSR